MSTKTEQLIAQKEAELAQIRATQYTQDLIEVLQNKKHTEGELYAVSKAFTAYVEKKMRQANLSKARANRKPKEEKKQAS